MSDVMKRYPVHFHADFDGFIAAPSRDEAQEKANDLTITTVLESPDFDLANSDATVDDPEDEEDLEDDDYDDEEDEQLIG